MSLFESRADHTVRVEALQFDGENGDDIRVLAGIGDLPYETTTNEVRFSIPTEEGYEVLHKGDWLVRFLNGKLFPFNNDLFKALYRSHQEKIDPTGRNFTRK